MAIRPLRHIIEAFYNSMSMTFDVISHSHVGSGSSATTIIAIDNVLNLRAGLSVTIGSTLYPVVSITSDKIFTVLGTVSPSTVTLPKPIYFAGSPLSVNNKIDEIPVPQFKVPMIWLYEVIRERRIQTEDSMTEREAAVRLFFLDEADFAAWETSTNQADYYAKVIDGMDRMAEYFKQKMYDSVYFGKFSEYNITSFAKFGVYTDNKGVLNSVFNEQLSGVELSLTLPINKILNC